MSFFLDKTLALSKFSIKIEYILLKHTVHLWSVGLKQVIIVHYCILTEIRNEFFDLIGLLDRVFLLKDVIVSRRHHRVPHPAID